MSGNQSPIFSRVGDVQGGVLLTLAAGDYTGQNSNNQIVFVADPINGGFVQRLRFKAIGTNVASVARIYVNNGNTNQLSTTTTPTTPTGTPSTTGGTLQTGTYFAKIQAIDQYGGLTAWSTESASVSVTGPTGSIAWSWTAVTGAVSYRILIGPVSSGEISYFTSTTNSFSQVSPIGTSLSSQYLLYNNYFVGELSLPATTASQTSSTTDIDYPLNFALPPGYRLVVGLGTSVAAGWIVTSIAGKY